MLQGHLLLRVSRVGPGWSGPAPGGARTDRLVAQRRTHAQAVQRNQADLLGLRRGRGPGALVGRTRGPDQPLPLVVPDAHLRPMLLGRSLADGDMSRAHGPDKQ